jgi:prepilin-type N-terminal cleavage/methylation domain-containing protein
VFDRRGSSPAFTLVELLIAISIIALLLSILSPSLKQAREQARRAVCGTHLRGLGTSWEVYTLEYGSPPQLARRGVDINWTCAEELNGQCVRFERVAINGFGPEHFSEYATTNSDEQVWISAYSYRNKLFQVSNPPPPGPLPGHWWNWGLMWLSGMVDNPRTFFCPSTRDLNLAWNTPLNPWPPRLETMWRPDNPHQVNHTDSGYERRAGLTGVPWDQIPAQTAIAHDVGMPVAEELAHRGGANVAYRGGHVNFVPGTRYLDWWDDRTDRWTNPQTRPKFLSFQYWLDTEGRWTPSE